MKMLSSPDQIAHLDIGSVERADGRAPVSAIVMLPVPELPMRRGSLPDESAAGMNELASETYSSAGTHFQKATHVGPN